MIDRAENVAWQEGVMRRVAAASFLPARAQGAVVLAFHQIAPATFERWMRLLQRSFALVSLDELVRRHSMGESLAGLLAVTFDDGWANTCEPIAELCERHGWPVMLYIVSRSCCEGTSLWFAELPRLANAARGRRIEADGWVLDLTTPRSERASTDLLIERLKVLPGREALSVVDTLYAAAGLAAPPAQRAFVDAAFVRKYSASAWVKFGSHTADHQALAPQDESGLEGQWVESRSALESLVGQSVRHFAYPYGAPGNIGSRAPGLVRRHYDSAVTMSRGVVSPGTDLSRIPRVPLYEEDTEAAMIAKIALAPWM